MPDYTYTREFGDTIHSNPDTYNIGHQGEPMDIAQRIKDALPGVDFYVLNNGTECKVITIESLTIEQEATLTATIAAQKAVDDWPYPGPDVTVSKVQITDFQDLTGHNVFRKGYDINATAGETINQEAKYSTNMYLQGLAFNLDDNVADGDYIEVEMVDVDNILGYGAGTVLGKFAETIYVVPNQQFECCCSDAKLVPAGIYIRYRYVSTGSTQVNIKLQHLLRTG